MATDKMSEIKTVFFTKLNITEADVDKSLSSLGLDSLDIVELLLELEDTYGIKFDTESMVNYNTVKDLLDAIESKLN